MNDGEVIIGVGTDTKNFDRQIKDTEAKLQQLEDEFESLSNTKAYANQEEDLQMLSVEIEKTKNKLVDLNKKQMDLNKTDVTKMKSNFDEIGNSISSVMKKTVKWGLAIFGIRSAYSAVQKAIGILSQYDTKIASDIEYIQFALASTLKPIIEWLIRSVYQILSYVASLIYSVSGINIFANATAKAFNKTTNEAKKLKKELTGIDKITKLSSADKSTTSSKTPSFDLSKIDTSITFDSALASIDSFIETIKSTFSTAFDTIKNNLMKVLLDAGFSKSVVAFIGTMIDGIKTIVLGFLDVLKGIFTIIIGLVSGDTEKIKQGIKTLIEGIKNILVGLVTFVVGKLGAIKAAIWSMFASFIESISKFTRPFGEKIGKIGKDIVKTITDTIKNIPKLLSETFDKIKGFFVDVGTKAGDLIGGAFKSAINLALEVVEKILNSGIKAINALKSSLGVLSVGIPELKPVKFTKLAKGGIINRPGAGVPVGSTIAGEHGQEWVQPLSDTAMLEKVGQAIGKYVKINVDFTAQMDSRTISRIIKEVENEKSFAKNGG